MSSRRATPQELEILLTPELQKWARMISAELPEGWGLGLMVFPFDEPDGEQSILWVSSAVRASMIEAIEKLAQKWRQEIEQ